MTSSSSGGAGAKAEKPATPKVVKPVKKLTQAEMKSPWRLAKVGDWLVFEPHFGKDRVRYEVTGLTETELTFTMTSLTKKKMLRPPVTMSFEDLESGWNDPDKLQPKPKFTTKELKLGDKMLKCRVGVREGLGSKTETWYAEGIGLNDAVVKSVRDGSVNLELKDFHKVP